MEIRSCTSLKKTVDEYKLLLEEDFSNIIVRFSDYPLPPLNALLLKFVTAA